MMTILQLASGFSETKQHAAAGCRSLIELAGVEEKYRIGLTVYFVLSQCRAGSRPPVILTGILSGPDIDCLE